MADTSWYYTHGGHRMGPVPLSELQSLVASTRVNNQELAWTAGMGDWARVIDLPILRDAPFRQRMLPAPAEAKPPTIDSAFQPTADTAQVAGALEASDAKVISIQGSSALAAGEMPAPPYVIPRTSLYGPVLLPPRPAATLVKHAEPRGDAADWPLDDERLTQFEIASEFRRPITGAAALYRMLTVLTAICSVAMLVVSICLWTLVARANNPAPGYLLFAGVLALFSAIFFFAACYTTRSNAAAPMTMFVLFMVITLLNLLGIYGLLRLDPISAVLCAIGGAFAIVFAIVSYRAYAAIPEFSRQPAWCQEMLIRARM